jgi:acyl-CoA thioester hydrolase
VILSDTDSQEVLYYGRYTPILDFAQLEYRRHLGLLKPGMREFAMRAVSFEFHGPAHNDDLIEVFVRPIRVGRSSVTFEFVVTRANDDVPLVTGTQTLVLMDHDPPRALAIPDGYRETVHAFEGADVEIVVPT